MRFSIKGHPNILATHRSTVEFTKDSDLSLKGDCIVGVDAGFDTKELKKLVKKYRELRCTIKVGKISDSFVFLSNKDFKNKKELVIRRSEFSSDRTLGTRTEKAAIDLDRNLVKRLKNKKTRAEVIIEPGIKVIIFDFDDTIEDYHGISHVAIANIGKRMHKINRADPKKVVDLFNRIHDEQRRKGKGKNPRYYDIASWMMIMCERLKKRITKKQAKFLADRFWDDVERLAKPMPFAKKTLNALGGRYSLAMLTDSDGLDDSFKIRRMKKLGLYGYFDVVITGNSVNQNKPSKKLYGKLTKTLEVSPEECVMVGDKHDSDLRLAHQLGMKTVLMDRYRRHAGKHFPHVDHHIFSLKELLDLF